MDAFIALIRKHLDVAGAIVAFVILTHIAPKDWGVVSLAGAVIVYFALQRWAK